MTFFESDIVRKEMTEIAELQQEVLGRVFNFERLPPEEQRRHVDIMEQLLEKQRVMYTRMSLSDDPEALAMKEEILKGCEVMGLPPNMDLNTFFSGMTKMLDQLRAQIKS